MESAILILLNRFRPGIWTGTEAAFQFNSLLSRRSEYQKGVIFRHISLASYNIQITHAPKHNSNSRVLKEIRRGIITPQTTNIFYLTRSGLPLRRNFLAWTCKTHDSSVWTHKLLTNDMQQLRFDQKIKIKLKNKNNAIFLGICSLWLVLILFYGF